MEEIKSTTTSHYRNVAVLVKIQNKSPLDFDQFLSALERSNQSHVADVRRVKINKPGEFVYFKPLFMELVGLECLYALATNGRQLMIVQTNPFVVIDSC